MQKSLARIAACAALCAVSFGASGQCARFPASASSAFDPVAGKIGLPWRTDLPSSAGSRAYPWQDKDFAQDWKAYIASVLDEVKASGVSIRNGRISMAPQAEWWIAPWMDFGASGRERINGLTAERKPDAGDLSPTSAKGYETWAIGWYNRPGAYGMGQIYQDPCDPKVPAGWRFPEQSAAFKLLFSSASASEVAYLAGAPEVEADTKRNGDATSATRLKLIQMDIAIRDPRAKDTHWVMGTFIWQGPPKGDGLFDNLVPVGLMWGNDPGVAANDWQAFAPLMQTILNADLAGVVWQGHGTPWPQRPFPGFQGRLNGPADNLRSSCLSCHATAQWRRNGLGMAPSLPKDPRQPDMTPEKVRALTAQYFTNTPGGTLVDPSSGQTPLDYSLQLEVGFNRMCAACSEGKLTGATPQVCQVPSSSAREPAISRATCDKNPLEKLIQFFSVSPAPEERTLPRQ
ncbi:hypothetical protein M5C99_09725 [Acidovorax sp. NCPPB 2350]|nr:hypothetical protein M5C99_09725 [Acidovorax sp. NCPPB 2350]